MNENRIITDRWSNPDAERLYRAGWPDDLRLKSQYEDGLQCGGCSFFAPFNADYGLCCNAASRHHTETVFEHFTCELIVNEDWGPHSFTDRATSANFEIFDKRKVLGHSDGFERKNEH